MYEDAKYIAEDTGGEPKIIKVLKNGKISFIPLDPANRHYKEIMALVEAGELTIEPAD
jgi:hypothetical protein